MGVQRLPEEPEESASRGGQSDHHGSDPDASFTINVLTSIRALGVELNRLMNHVASSEREFDLMAEALTLALHSQEQQQSKAATLSHPMRSAVRLIRDYGVEDLHAVIALLLRRSVEENPLFLARFVEPLIARESHDLRKNALAAIEEKFGDEVLALMNAIVAPEPLVGGANEEESRESGRSAYREYLNRVVGNQTAFFLILADAEEGALKIREVDSEVRRLAMKIRYAVEVRELTLLLESKDAALPLTDIAREQMARRFRSVYETSYSDPM